MEHAYPAGPVNPPPNLTKPTSAYKRHAYIAIAGLLLFLGAYLTFAGWLTWTAYRLISHAGRSDNPVVAFAGGIAAAFLAVFLWKALIFKRRDSQKRAFEITATEHPHLLAFIHRIADDARAPRPRRVFLSPEVNAAVFFDFSFVNLIFPSRKNLVIGLGLVNVLTLSELKAVVAHEFGHFAQRTMAVGRWVYTAQQIAGHIVVKRDALDRFLMGLSNIDIRIAWIGWIMRLIVWSIRSVADTVFSIVLLAERALSREMELQADLVAVSLSGSDALIHALHRLSAADDAMDRAFSFAESERANGRAIADLFTIQTAMLDKKRDILADPSYGKVPPLPASPASHRLFTTELAQPPRMWSTHPPNDVRELNAKRVYVPAALDDRSGWVLFEDPAKVRAALTAHVYRNLAESDPTKPLDTPPIEETLAKIQQVFARQVFDPTYRGAYLGRSIVRHAARVEELYGTPPDNIVAALEELYPPTLPEALERVRELDEEKVLLRALERGILEAPGGVVRYRGQDHRRRDLPKLLETVERELAAARAIVTDHDKRVRTVHLAAARAVSPEWEAYLRGMLALVHYAEHRDADLDDAMGSLNNVVSVVLADQKVTEAEMHRLVAEASSLYTTLHSIYDEADQVDIGETISEQLQLESWRAALGTLEFGGPHETNMGQWLESLPSWVDGTCGPLSAVAGRALNELLRAEDEVALAARSGRAAEAPPAPPRVPPRYTTLVFGNERKRQTKLGWWDRFQIADGLVPGVLRFAVSGAIVGGVVWAGASVTANSKLLIVNGLARIVNVDVGDRHLELGVHDSRVIEVEADETYVIRTRTEGGAEADQLIETFSANVEPGNYVYNVAQAAPLTEWDPSTDDKTVIGAPRWMSVRATEVSIDPGRLSRSSNENPLLVGFTTLHPSYLASAQMAKDDAAALAASHAKWDPPGTAHLEAWLEQVDNKPEILDARLTVHPDDVVARRAEQNRGPHDEVCARHRKTAEQKPDSPEWGYLAARCLDDLAARNEAYLALAKKWPDSPWPGLARAGVALDQGNYEEGERLLVEAKSYLPDARGQIIEELARLGRMRGVPLSEDIVEEVPRLRGARILDGDESLPPGGMKELEAYVHLASGDLPKALETASGTRIEPSIQVLVAASDGATPEDVDRALAIPTDKVEGPLAFYAFAIASRAKRDVEPYRALLLKQREASNARMIEFLDAARTAKDPAAIKVQMSFGERTLAYAAGTVILGDKAPTEWRTLAKGALFVYERPFFRAGGDEK
jgi:Zn-dependent protease with chaperone function